MPISSRLGGKLVPRRVVPGSGELERSHGREACVSPIKALKLPVDKSSKRICNA